MFAVDDGVVLGDIGSHVRLSFWFGLMLWVVWLGVAQPMRCGLWFIAV